MMLNALMSQLIAYPTHRYAYESSYTRYFVPIATTGRLLPVVDCPPNTPKL